MGQTRLQLAPRHGREDQGDTRETGASSDSLVPALVAEQLQEALPGTSTGVFVGSGETLHLTGATGPLARLTTAPTLVETAFAARRVVMGDDDDLAELREQGVEAASIVAAPLLVDREAIGTLLIAADDGVASVPEPAQLASFARVAAMLLRYEARAAAGEAEARRDMLTGVANRRAFEEALSTRLESDDLATRRFALVLLDLDNFKQINDSAGHGIGDEVLRVVAQSMLAKARAGEDLFRIGGDEFALLINGDAAAARTAVGRLQDAVRSIAFPTGPLNVSAGIATAPADGASTDQLLHSADSALYAAKAAGKSERRRGSGLPIARAERNSPRQRVLVVDDDPGIRSLLRSTLGLIPVLVDEAGSGAEAFKRLRETPPDVIVLDVGLAHEDGLEVCRRLKAEPRTASIPVLVLSGAEEAEHGAREAGAAAFARKPFSPLELSTMILELAGADAPLPATVAAPAIPVATQLGAYATDLGRLLEVGMRQQSLLDAAYRQTVGVLAAALDSKDAATALHSQRVVAYASEIAQAVAPALLDDPTLEYGFLLHDVGKIGVPDSILKKRGPLTAAERGVIEFHPVLGADLLNGVTLLAGEGLRVVRSHHERWDGGGYPDALALTEIPLGARIFAVADTLDAMTGSGSL
jgi:diguanylate cyclase (GGDEF)-like protein